jgi:CheY-like chemotaxis protein
MDPPTTTRPNSPRHTDSPEDAGASVPTPAVLHRVSLVGFGAFERTTFDLFFRMSEQRAGRQGTTGAHRPQRDRGYLQVAPSHHPELVLINGDAPQAVRQAWRWPGRCICIGGQSFDGAIRHLPRPVHMNSLLGALDELTEEGRLGTPSLPARPPATEPERSGGRAGVALRLLVVDDNANTLRSIGRFLRRQGLAATYARSGEEALWRVSQGRFELVLLDSRMRGISGWVTCRLMKTRPYGDDQHAPRVVMMARHEGVFDALYARLSRCDQRLHKPLRKQDLLPIVRPLRVQHATSPSPTSTGQAPLSSLMGV